MTTAHRLLAVVLGLCLLVLAGCSSTSGSRSGGYYKDDGPGNDIPANIEAIPNAVPRIEQHARANFKPYVVFGKRYVPISDERPFRQVGTASWYGKKFHGNKTANGEIYDMYGMSAAHPTLPIPSYARVTRAKTGKSVIVRINDRGPFHSSRIIDLSYVAAAKLGLIGPGSGQVIVEAITNQDIRNNSYDMPKAAPIPVAPPPAPAPVLTVRSEPASGAQQAPAVPDALAALEHSDEAIINEGPSGDPGDNVTPPSASTEPLDSTSAQPVAAGDEIYLQFGAFSSMQTADDLALKLNTKIAHTETRQAYVESSNALYRVRTGPYPSRTAAVNAAIRIEQRTGLPSSVALR